MAFAFVHGVLLTVIIRKLFTLSIKNDQIINIALQHENL